MNTGVNIGLIQYWFANKGGMEQHVLALAKVLKAKGFDIRFFVAYPINITNEYVVQLRNDDISVFGSSDSIKEVCENKDSFKYYIARLGLKVHCVYLKPMFLLLLGLIKGRSFRSRAINTWRFMRNLDPDKLMLLSSALKLCTSHCYEPLNVVHVNGFRIEVGWAIRWADQFSIPSVYTEHSTVTDWLDFEGMDIEAVNLADCVASVSCHACEELRKLSGLQYVALVKHALPAIESADESRLSSEIAHLVCVAELSPNKRVSVLIDAFAEVLVIHPHLKLHIVGDGPERLKICERVEAAGISSQVHLHGSVSNREVNQILKESDLMILPSLSEGLPVSILEALANAVPVIASDKGGIPEIIRHGENGFLFSSGDSADIAAAIILALNRNADWSEVSAKARQSFEAYENKSFSAVDEIIDIYDQAIFNRQFKLAGRDKTKYPKKTCHCKLSVVIPTHNPTYLDQTLSGLTQQIEKRFEVLIVENGSSSSLAKDLISRYSEILDICYFHLQEGGLNRARNYGVSKANSDIIALIDDDAIPDREWTKEVLHCHRLHPEAGIVGGPVKLSFPAGDPGWVYPPFRESLSEVDYGEFSRELEYPEWLAGTNFSFRKKVYTRAGAFLEDIGPSSENNYFGCNDETEFLMRASKYGMPGIYYDACMVVEHIIPGTRLSMNSLEKRYASQGYSDLQLTSKYQNEIPWRDWWKFLYHALEADKWHRKMDDLPVSLPLNIRQEFYKNLVMTRIAFLEGMLQFILSSVATSEYVESLALARSRYQQQGRKWVESQAIKGADEGMLLYKNLSCLMLKKRWTWSLSERFTEYCIFGRIFFFIEIKESIKKHSLH